jgi:hypothetical protein
MKPNFWARKLFDFGLKVLFEVWTKSGANLVSFCMGEMKPRGNWCSITWKFKWIYKSLALSIMWLVPSLDVLLK